MKCIFYKLLESFLLLSYYMCWSMILSPKILKDEKPQSTPQTIARMKRIGPLQS